MVHKPSLFISYRRSDTEAVTERLAGRLKQDFGDDQVFRDADDMILGQDWREVIDRRITGSDATLVMVGAGWQDGNRIFETEDPVAAEVRLALDKSNRSTPLPILIDLTEPPPKSDVPEDIYELFDRSNYLVTDQQTLIESDQGHYQKILAGVYESVRQRVPDGVLVVGSSRVDVDKLIGRLKQAKLVDAREITRFASGVCVVSRGETRRFRKRYDVFVDAPEDRSGATPNATLSAAGPWILGRAARRRGSGATPNAALIAALAALPTVESVKFVGAAAKAAVAAASASQPTHTGGASLVAAKSPALLGTVAAKVAAAGLVATVATAAVVLPDRDDGQVEFASTIGVEVDGSGDERLFPFGEPDGLVVRLGPESEPVETGFGATVEREVSLEVPGIDNPLDMGTVEIVREFSDDRLGGLADRVLVGDVSTRAALPESILRPDEYCYLLAEPETVVGGWEFTGAEQQITVYFVAEIEDAKVVTTVVEVEVEGPAAPVFYPEYADQEGAPNNRCIPRSVNVVWSD